MFRSLIHNLRPKGRSGNVNLIVRQIDSYGIAFSRTISTVNSTTTDESESQPTWNSTNDDPDDKPVDSFEPYKQLFERYSIPNNPITETDSLGQNGFPSWYSPLQDTQMSSSSSSLKIDAKAAQRRRPNAVTRINSRAEYSKDWWYDDLKFKTSSLFLEESRRIRYKTLASSLASNPGSAKIDDIKRCIHDSPSGLVYLNLEEKWVLYSLLVSLSMSSGEVAPLLSKYDFQKVLSELVKGVELDENSKKVDQIGSFALRIYSDMKKNGIVPDAATHKYMFRALKGNISHLKLLHEHIMDSVKEERERTGRIAAPPVDEESFRTLLASIVLARTSDPRKFQLLQALWFDMKKLSIELTTRIGVGFIYGFGQMTEGGMEGLMNVHMVLEQRKKTEPWSRHVFDALMDVYAEKGSQRIVKSLYFRLCKVFDPSMENYKAYLKAHTHANLRQETILYLGDLMHKKNLPRDDDVIGYILNACTQVCQRSLIRSKCHGFFQVYIEKCKKRAERSVDLYQAALQKNLAVPTFKPIFPHATPFSYFRLITAYSSLGDLAAAIRALEQWKDTREWVCKVQAVRSESFIQSLKSDGIDPTPGTEHVDRYPPPAMFALAALSRCFANRADLKASLRFFEKELFNPIVVGAIWSKILRRRSTDIDRRIAELEHDIKNSKTESKVDHMKKLITSFEKKRNTINLGDFNTGDDGPFKRIYESFTKGWYLRVDDWYNTSLSSSLPEGGQVDEYAESTQVDDNESAKVGEYTDNGENQVDDNAKSTENQAESIVVTESDDLATKELVNTNDDEPKNILFDDNEEPVENVDPWLSGLNSKVVEQEHFQGSKDDAIMVLEAHMAKVRELEIAAVKAYLTSQSVNVEVQSSSN